MKTIFRLLLFLCALSCAHALHAGSEVVYDLDFRTINLWDAGNVTPLGSLKGHGGSVNCVAYSPDGKILASASDDGTAKLWDIATKKEIATLSGDKSPLWAVAFSPDGKLLATASETVRLWDLAERKLIRAFALKEGSDEIKKAHVTGAGTLLSRSFTSLSFSPDGQLLTAGNMNNTITLWSTGTGVQVKTFNGHTDAVISVAFVADGKLIASSSADGTVKLWNRESGEAHDLFRGSHGLTVIAASMDGRTLASGGNDRTIKLWDVSSYKNTATLSGDSATVLSLAFSRDGKFLLSGGWDSTIKLWDLSTGKPIREYKRDFRVTSVAFNPNGKTFASASVLASRSRASTLYILTIGVNKYPEFPLRYAVADAQDLADEIERVGKSVFERIEKTVLLDEGATRETIEGAFAKVAAEAKPQDLLVFHFAGYDGMPKTDSSNASEFYMLPFNFGPRERDDANALTSKGVSATELRALLAKVMARRQLIVLDTCSSSQAFEAFVSQIGATNQDLRELLQRDMVVLTSEGMEVETPRLGHGLLTYALLQALRGEANELSQYLGKEKRDRDVNMQEDASDRKNVITTRELEAYIYSKVMVLGNAFGATTRPRIYRTGNDFDIGYSSSDTTAAFTRPQAAPLRAGIVGVTPGDKPLVEKRGKNYALLFATDDYDNAQWPHLNNPIRDATEIERLLKEFYGFQTKLVPNPRRKDIMETLDKYKDDFDGRKYEPEDQLFVFFAGHGTYNTRIDTGYVIARDSAYEEGNYPTTYLSHPELYRAVDAINCNHIFITLDVCYGGTFGKEGGATRSADVSDSDIQPAMLKTRIWLTSGGKDYVSDGEPEHHSPFAEGLINALDPNNNPRELSYLEIMLSITKIKRRPIPRWGFFPSNVPGSDFVLVAKS